MRLFQWLLLCLGLFSLVGCPPSTGSDDDDSSAMDDDDAVDDDDAMDDDDAANDDDAADPCGDFCAGVMATCTGANEQYGGDTATCEAECAGWAAGAAGDTTGDTFACRDYHLGAAETDADTHCAHAGGQAVCVD